jgi:hypothetical protein
MHTIGQLTAAVISEQLERAAGSPEAAAAHPERFCEAIAAYAGVEPHEGLQLVHPLAFLYATEFSGNRWFRNPALLEAARAAGWRLLAWMRETRDHTPVRRKGHPLVRAFALLRADLPDQAEWKAGISEVIGRLFLPLLRERERLTVLTSANVGYGTNHLACELSAVTAYLRAFRNDPDFGRMDPGGPGLEDYLRGWLARFMDHQDEAGYWPETDGPANLYNLLTGNALLRAAMDLGEVETYRSHFERAAHFHTWYILPNLQSVGVTDGRNHQGDGARLSAFFGFIPEGRALMECALRARQRQLQSGARFGGETLNEFLTNILAEPHFAPGEGRLIWQDAAYTDRIRDDFAVFKRGPWIGALSNLRFRPRPEGHWTLDHQNLFSLYHQEFGVVLRGNNSKNDPELATFNKAFAEFDSRPLAEPLWQHVPDRGRFRIGDRGCALEREYRGFEGRLDFEVLGPRSAVLRIGANARLCNYPVTCSLQPAAGFGRGFTDGHGRRVELDEKPFTARGRELGGAMVLTPEPRPDAAGDAPGRPLKLSLPDDAEVIWPFLSWNCYDLETHRYGPRQGTLLLKIPVSPAGAALGFDLSE